MLVCAIDVGYGNVKFSRTENGMTRYDHFPSIAALSLHDGEVGDGVTARKDIIPVTVGNESYRVGKDAALALPANESGRILNPDYHKSNPYLALFRGALGYMGKPRVIDLLVTGLPVEHFLSGGERGILEARITGEHAFPDGSSVLIKQGWAIPQPVGGFLQHAWSTGVYDELRESLCLVVDCGFGTVDWVVSKGLKVTWERSGSVPGGLSQPLTRLAKAISDEQDGVFVDIDLLDAAVRGGRKIDLFGSPYDFGHLLPKVMPMMDQVANSLLDRVGRLSDISAVVLVGGGAPLYLESIRKICPRNRLVLVDEALYANVKGYLLAGERRIKTHG